MGIMIVQLGNLSERQKGTRDESYAVTPNMSLCIFIAGIKWMHKDHFANVIVWTPTSMETRDDRETLNQKERESFD